MNSGLPHTGFAAASSHGVVSGRIQKLDGWRIPIPEYEIQPEQVEQEILRLYDAVASAAQQMDDEMALVSQVETSEPLRILHVHRMLLLDQELLDKTSQIIRDRLINTEWALRRQLNHIEAMFERIEDTYLRERKKDIQQVGQRLFQQLLSQSNTADINTSKAQILMAHDFSPSEVVTLWQLGVTGLIAEQGGNNSHAIIVARGLGLPMLVGAGEVLDSVNDGDFVILDAENGCWTLNPSDADYAACADFVQNMNASRIKLHDFAHRPSLSHNGHAMPLMANLSLLEEVEAVHFSGAEGAGLFRTEFLYLQNQQPPDEQIQFQHYASVVQKMQGLPTTFRLLDIGGDKPALFQQLGGRHYGGENPAMSLRGVRMLLRWPEVMMAQIRALVKASELGPVQVLVPMVTMVEELEQVRDIFDLCQRELGISRPIPLGAMIEVPAAVMVADELGKVADFFSIGTNDLIQYTLATDRGDEEVVHLYQPEHPAVRKLIQYTVDAAKQANIPVAVCGELASDPAWTQTFLNMGMSSLSMSPQRILSLREHLSSLDYSPTAIH